MKVEPPSTLDLLKPEIVDALVLWGGETRDQSVERWTDICREIIFACPTVWRSSYGLSCDQMVNLIPKCGSEDATLSWLDDVSTRFESPHAWPGRKGAHTPVLKFIQARLPLCSEQCFRAIIEGIDGPGVPVTGFSCADDFFPVTTKPDRTFSLFPNSSLNKERF